MQWRTQDFFKGGVIIKIIITTYMHELTFFLVIVL